MKKRSLRVKKCRVLLAAILLIAIAMPLVHPLLHHHGDCDHASPGCQGEQLRPEGHAGHAHECPLCGFLATHQLLFDRLHFPAAGAEAIDRSLFGPALLPIKAVVLPVEARAPPITAPTA